MKWHDIPGFPGYAASRSGEIYSRKRDVVRKQVLQHDDRLFVCLYLGAGKRCQAAVHRLVALTFLGPAPTSSHVVNHKNGDHHDNRAENLEWTTRAENEAHAVIHGLKASGLRNGRHTCPESTARGERHGRAKLTESQVDEIIEARSNGETLVSLAHRFGVSKTRIGQIATGDGWKRTCPIITG